MIAVSHTYSAFELVTTFAGRFMIVILSTMCMYYIKKMVVDLVQRNTFQLKSVFIQVQVVAHFCLSFL